jgi:hypothetical protein
MATGDPRRDSKLPHMVILNSAREDPPEAGCEAKAWNGDAEPRPPEPPQSPLFDAYFTIRAPGSIGRPSAQSVVES